MTTILDNYKRTKVSQITNIFNVELNKLNSILSHNIRIINNSRMRNKLRAVKILINNYNNKVKNLRNKLNFDIQNINMFNSNFPSEFKNKKALLIGINYFNTDYELNGCIRDIEKMKEFLETKGFNYFNIMTDLTNIKPTRINILNKIKNFISSAVDGDLLFIHFSGHGSYTYDFNNDETDGNDEAIISCDLEYIIDDEIKSIINQFSRKNISIIGIFDSCNSGTMMDLKYNYNYFENKYIENVRNIECSGNVLMISGCMDDQISSEAVINGELQGALTATFMETINKNPNCTWKNLMCDMCTQLKSNNFTQIPQISTNIFYDIDNSKVF
jgi:hypothetical protein